MNIDKLIVLSFKINFLEFTWVIFSFRNVLMMVEMEEILIDKIESKV